MGRTKGQLGAEVAGLKQRVEVLEQDDRGLPKAKELRHRVRKRPLVFRRRDLRMLRFEIGPTSSHLLLVIIPISIRHLLHSSFRLGFRHII
jgi:hypothetical protein